MHAIIVTSALNTLQALNRVVSLLRGRDFRVESFAVADSERPGVARLTIVVDATQTRPDRVASCLDKIEEVWGARRVEREESVQWEAALVKVAAGAVSGEQVSALLGSGAARVIDQRDGAAILEVAGTSEEVGQALRSLADVGTLEVARCGPLVMARGHQPTTPVTPPV